MDLRHYLYKSFIIEKLFLFLHGLLRGLLSCFLDWLGRTRHHFVIRFQVPLARTSSCHKRSTFFCSENNFFLLWISKRGNIHLGFSRRSAHHIARGCFCFAFGFFIGDSSPLLIDNVRVHPHYLSIGSRDMDETLLFLVVRISIAHSQFSFGMGTTLIDTDRRSWSN